MALLDQIIAALVSLSGGQAVALIALVLEAVLRLVKSEKPLSLLLVVSVVLHKVARVAELAASLLDKVLPQRVVEAPKG